MSRTIRSRIFRSWTVVATVLALQAFVNPWVGATDPSSLRGVVVSSAAGGPIAGVRLHAGERGSGQSFASEATGMDGTFRLGTLPSGEYDLAVEAGGGLYLVQTPVVLAPGETRSVEVRFDPKKKRRSPEDPEVGEFKKPTALDNPATATLIVVGFAFAAGALDELFEGDDDEDDASPSTGG